MEKQLAILNDQEQAFQDCLVDLLKYHGVEGFLEVTSMSNNTLVFALNTCGLIGKAKIRGRKTRMQFLRMDGNDLIVEWVEGMTLDEMISYLDRWVVYAKTEEKRRKIKKYVEQKGLTYHAQPCLRCKHFSVYFETCKRGEARASLSIMTLIKRLKNKDEECVVACCQRCKFRWVV